MRIFANFLWEWHIVAMIGLFKKVAYVWLNEWTEHTAGIGAV